MATTLHHVDLASLSPSEATALMFGNASLDLVRDLIERGAYVPAAEVEADPREAFNLIQNLDDHWWKSPPEGVTPLGSKRSTMVGDVAVVDGVASLYATVGLVEIGEVEFGTRAPRA